MPMITHTGNGQDSKTYEPALDADGFPPIGTLLKDGDPYYGYDIFGFKFFLGFICIYTLQ